jgi:hypothetical protein
MNFTKNFKVTRASDAVANGTSAVNSSAIDMKGFYSCTFLVAAGTITDSPATGISIKVQQCVDSTSSPETWADLEDTSVSAAVSRDNDCLMVEVTGPRERYLRCVVTRTSSTVIDGIFAFQGGADSVPVTHDSSTVADTEHHLAPAEGTA